MVWLRTLDGLQRPWRRDILAPLVSKEVPPVADLLLLTSASGGSAQVLPALGLLSHRIRVLPVEPSALVDAPDAGPLPAQPLERIHKP